MVVDKWIKETMVFLSLLLMVSVIYSKFVLSLSMIGFVLLALYHKKRDFRFWKNKSYLLISVLFLLFVVSGINSDNTSEWIHHMRMRLPFLALPFAFYKLPRISKRDYYLLHYALIIIFFLSAIPVFVHYITHFEEMQKALGMGQPIPTPVNHTKYSLFISFAGISGLILYYKGFIFKYPWEKWLILSVSIFLMVFVHILAVRSGIVVLYLAITGIALFYTFRNKDYKKLLIALAFIIITPYIAYKSIPSLNKRVHYMVYDYNKYKEGKGDQYSDSDRIQSLQVGSSIFINNPIIGVGIGDLKEKCTEEYKIRFGPDKYVLYPHNQYLFILAATGFIGFLIFIIGFLGPFIVNHHYNNYFLFALLIIYSGAFLVDNVLERSFSAAFFVFFLCLGISYCDKVEETSEGVQ